MPKFEVRETYTPDDHNADRERNCYYFESDSTNLMELAVEACKSTYPQPVSPETEAEIRAELLSDLVDEQLEENECTVEFLEYTLYGNERDHGEYYFHITQVDAAVK